jgi:hypothetical protein
MVDEILNDVGEVLDLMALAEARVRNFYRACAGQWERDKEFWLGLAAEEDAHYARVMRLSAMAAASPAAYSLRGGFKPAAYRSFADMLRDSALAVSCGAMDETEAVRTAQLVENSILESSVLRAVATENKEFLELLAGMEEQTRGHAALVKARLEEVTRRAAAGQRSS